MFHILVSISINIDNALSEEQKTVSLAQMSLRNLSEYVILIDLVYIQVTCCALLKLATTSRHEMRLQIASSAFFVCLAVGEDAVLYSHF